MKRMKRETSERTHADRIARWDNSPSHADHVLHGTFIGRTVAASLPQRVQVAATTTNPNLRAVVRAVVDKEQWKRIH